MNASGTDIATANIDGLEVSGISHNASILSSTYPDGDFTDNATGTHFQGRLNASFGRLVELFGAPIRYTADNSDGKVRAEWVVKVTAVEDGEDGDYYSGFATIYDWKCDAPVGDITEWHIGGKDGRAAHYLSLLVERAASEWGARTYE